MLQALRARVPPATAGVEGPGPCKRVRFATARAESQISMVRRRAVDVLCGALRFRGLCRLPPEFAAVARGCEWGPEGQPLWRKGRPPKEILTGCLSFLSSHLLGSSIPSSCGFQRGDASIFARPPVRRAEGGDGASNGVCLVFTSAQVAGLKRSGRYRQLVLGTGRDGRTVVIGAHRLVCWAFRGPLAAADRLVARHTDEGCEQRLACCSPLHLKFGTRGDNRRDVDTRRARLDRARRVNLLKSRRRSVR